MFTLVHWKPCSGLPIVLIKLFSLGLTAEALPAKIDFKNWQFCSNAVTLTQNFKQKVYLADDCHLLSDAGRRTLRSHSNDIRKLLVPRTQQIWRQEFLGSRSSTVERSSTRTAAAGTFLRFIQTFFENTSLRQLKHLVTLWTYRRYINKCIYLSIYVHGCWPACECRVFACFLGAQSLAIVLHSDRFRCILR